MKLFFLYLTLVFTFLAIGMQAFRDTCGKAVSDGGMDKKYVLTQAQPPGEQHRLPRAYCLIKQSFSPVKQIDVPDDGSSWMHLPYKIFHPVHRSGDVLLSGTVSARKFMRLLSERHSGGFYIYSFGKLIV